MKNIALWYMLVGILFWWLYEIRFRYETMKPSWKRALLILACAAFVGYGFLLAIQ